MVYHWAYRINLTVVTGSLEPNLAGNAQVPSGLDCPRLPFSWFLFIAQFWWTLQLPGSTKKRFNHRTWRETWSKNGWTLKMPGGEITGFSWIFPKDDGFYCPVFRNPHRQWWLGCLVFSHVQWSEIPEPMTTVTIWQVTSIWICHCVDLLIQMDLMGFNRI